MTAPHLIDFYHYSAGWCEEPRCYTAACAEFQGLTAQSDTAEHAIELLKSTVHGIVTGMFENGETIPKPLDETFNDCT